MNPLPGSQNNNSALTGKVFPLIIALFALNAIIYIWLFRFLPLQDYPDWLFQGHIFSEMLKGHAAGSYSLLRYPIPNTISTLIIGLLGLAFSPEASGKLFLSCYTLLFVFSSFYLFRQFTRGEKSPLILIPLLFIFNNNFFLGNINYLTGLSLLFLGMGLLFKHKDSPEKAGMWSILILSLLIFLSHGIIYFIWLAFLAVFALLHAKRKQFAGLALGTAPSLALLAGYILSRPAGQDAAATSGALQFLKFKTASAIGCFSILPHFYPYLSAGDLLMKAAVFVNYAVCAGILLAFIFSLKTGIAGLKENKLVIGAAALCLFLFLAAPSFLAGVVDPGQRFLYPAFWLALAMLSQRIPPRLNKVLACFIFFLLAGQGVYLYSYAGGVSRDMERIYAGLNKLSAEAPAQSINEAFFDYEKTFQRPCARPPLASVYPLGRLCYYSDIEKELSPTIFDSGILYYKGSSPQPRINSVSEIAAAKIFPGRIIITGEKRGNAKIAGLLKEKYKTLIEEEHSVLLERKP